MPDEAQRRLLLELDTIFTNASLGILYTRDRVFQRCNPRASAILGYATDELVGQPGAVIYPSQADYEALGRAAGPKLTAGESFSTELQLLRKDGSRVWCQVFAKAFDAQNTQSGTIWIFDDIEEARHTRTELEAIMNNAPFGIVFTRDRVIQRYNPKFAEMLRLGDHSLINRPARTFFESDTAYAALGEAASPLLSSGKPFQSEMIMRRHDDSLFPAEVVAYLINPANPSQGTIWTVNDITERYADRELLRTAVGKLEALMTNASVPILFTCDRKMVQHNGQFGKVFGFEGNAAIGQSARILFRSDEEYAEVGRVAGPLLSTGRPYRQELFMRRQDGSDLWINLIGYVSNPQDPTQGTYWLLEDRTDFKQAEEALRQSHAELERRVAERTRDLEAAKARQQDFAEAASDWLWEMGPDLRFTYFSERIGQTLGIDTKTLLGLSRRQIMDPADIDAKWENHFAVLDQRLPFRDLEYCIRLPGGRSCEISISGKPVFDAAGVFLGYRGVGRDITERKQAEDQLRQAASVFEHANEGIMITDAAGTILDVNAAFTRITGYERDEALGRNPRILSSGRQGPEFYIAMWQTLEEEGRWSGEIWNRRKNGEIYAELMTISAIKNDAGDVLRYVALFSDITTLKQHQQEMEHIAHHDALTSLPNRMLLADRLKQAIAQAMRRESQVAVVYLDLDGFKEINDIHGHGVGDQLLIELAGRMKQALREGDTLSRLGGDEFVAVLLDLENREASEPILKRMLRAAAEPVPIDDLKLCVSASIGVSFFPQAEDVDADHLLRQADQAMYQAKQSGKNRYYLFDTEQDRALRGRHESIERVREGLENREFVLFYQPKINMRTGEVIGAEALIRWQHPEQGLLPPAKFLPLIENDDLIIMIGDWTIDAALAQMEAWRAAGLKLPVSVNIAGRQLQSPAFLDKIRAALYLHPDVAGQLELEVLESSALDDINQVSQVIESCRTMGVDFALDDFGTGYSSLTYLKRLPARTLKIDQSFVRDMLEDPEDLAILDGIVGLAESFQRRAIAEGIETEAHGEMLLRLGCELGQGYAIARPMPAETVAAWVADRMCEPLCEVRPRIERQDMPVLFAMTEHRAWIKTLGLCLQKKQGPPPPLDHHQCRFGQWLDQSGAKRYADDPAMSRILPLHEMVHGKARELLELKQNGRSGEALARFGEIEVLRDNLLSLLQQLLDGGERGPADAARG